MDKALFFIYIMIGVTLYSLVNSVCIYLFYTDLCLPSTLPIQVDSFFHFLDHFVTYELWLMPLYHYFWPTVQNKAREISYFQAVTLSRSWTDQNTSSPSNQHFVMESNAEDQSFFETRSSYYYRMSGVAEPNLNNQNSPNNNTIALYLANSSNSTI